MWTPARPYAMCLTDAEWALVAPFMNPFGPGRDLMNQDRLTGTDEARLVCILEDGRPDFHAVRSRQGCRDPERAAAISREEVRLRRLFGRLPNRLRSRTEWERLLPIDHRRGPSRGITPSLGKRATSSTVLRQRAHAGSY
jgi:hypothetical protein